MLHATNEWFTNMDEGLLNAVIFLDLTKAFETIKRGNPSILTEKLRLNGVDNIPPSLSLSLSLPLPISPSLSLPLSLKKQTAKNMSQTNNYIKTMINIYCHI